MSDTRLTLTPDPRFMNLAGALENKLTAIASSLTSSEVGALLDNSMQQCLKYAFREAGADEGTVWIAEAESKSLVVAFNSGPDAGRMVGKFAQPLSEGLISMVFANESPFMENALEQDARQDKTLDTLLGVKTLAMIAVPLNYLESCRGVVSCVLLGREGATSHKKAFTEADQARIQHATTVLGRLIDNSVLRTLVGLS